MKFRIMEGVKTERPDPGEILIDAGLSEEALPFIEDALSKYPNEPRHWNNLGKAQKHLGRLEEAIKSFEKAVTPRNPIPIYNMALVLEDLGKFAEAEKGYEVAISAFQQLGTHERQQLQGQERKFCFALASCYMRRGEFEKAWPFWRVPRDGCPRVEGLPVWQGEEIGGKRILVIREGGYGDEILYLRYLSKLQALGAHVTFWGSRAMRGLLMGHPWLDWWMDEGDEGDSEKFDYQVSLWSIMDVLNLPHLKMGSEPYIKPRTVINSISAASDRNGCPSVGICWKAAESPNYWRKHRAIQKDLLEGLKDISVRWVSLQYGETPPSWMHDVDDLMELGWEWTARVVASLDYVVSVDTAMIHLAGAMGKPALLVSPLNVDWKWGAAQETTPWYPSVRIVRNTEPISFAPAVEEVKKILTGRYAEKPVEATSRELRRQLR